LFDCKKGRGKNCEKGRRLLAMIISKEKKGPMLMLADFKKKKKADRGAEVG